MPAKMIIIKFLNVSFLQELNLILSFIKVKMAKNGDCVEFISRYQ